MKSLFEVNAYDRFKEKKITVSVYGVRTDPRNSYKAEFLVFYGDRWIWSEADNYTPINNKHE